MAVKDSGPRTPPLTAGRIRISVGVHSDDGAVQHDTASFGDDGALVPSSDLTIAELATIHEFGLGVPQRSFIRAWFDEHQDFIAQTLRSQFSQVAGGRLTADVAAERCALAFEGSVKQRIARGVPPPNAPSTIARKGSSKPLIATGQLRAAVRGRVDRG